MKQVWAIAKKELLNFITQPVGYVFAGLLVIVANWIYFGDIFVLGQADISPFFSTIIFLFSIFIPAISMGLIADEKKSGNWEVILSLPINELQMVLGKFIGSCLYLLGVSILFVPSILIVYWLGRPEIGIVAGGFLGMVLIGVAYLAVGLLASCLTNSSVVAFLVTTIFLVINNMFSQENLLTRLPAALKQVLLTLSLAEKSGRLSTGLINFNDMMFFISWILISIILSVTALKGRDK